MSREDEALREIRDILARLDEATPDAYMRLSRLNPKTAQVQIDEVIKDGLARMGYRVVLGD